MIESVTYCQICGSKLEKHISQTIHHPYCNTCKKISYVDPKVATVIIITWYAVPIVAIVFSNKLFNN